jgi:membrane protease YdiL (CAAX protease family)
MNDTAKKVFKVLLYCIGFAALNVIMQIIVTVPYSISYMIFSSGSQALSGNPNMVMQVNVEELTRSIMMPMMLSAIVLTFGIAWLIHVLCKKNFYERLSLNKTTPFLAVTSFIAGLALQIPTSDFISFLEHTGVMSDKIAEYTKSMEAVMTGQSFLLQIIVIGILAPVIEEIIFRGLVFDQLRKNIPLSLALIIQALLFGIAHLNLIQGLYAFLLGLLMGIALIRSRSLILPVAIHLGMNLSGVIISELQNLINDNGVLILRITSYVLAAAYIVVLFLKTKSKVAQGTELS